jgi:hypothetical protein
MPERIAVHVRSILILTALGYAGKVGGFQNQKLPHGVTGGPVLQNPTRRVPVRTSLPSINPAWRAREAFWK